MSRMTRVGALVAGLTLAASSMLSPAHGAPSSDAGLYGAADPTYDGVFRQSLAISGLVAAGIDPAPASLGWLLAQQCADGGFQAYRADRGSACTPSDPVNFAGEDSNATATALIALTAVDTADAAKPATRPAVAKAAKRAAGWLRANQGKDGGWAYYPGSASDANSTGLALAALKAAGAPSTTPAITRGTAFLASLALRCTSGGGLKFQDGGAANTSATAQAFAGLAGALPVAGPRVLAATPACGRSVTSKAATYLSSRLAADGALASSFGSGADYTSTAFAVLGFVQSRTGKAAVAKGTAALAAAARQYTSGNAAPSALGLLLMVAEATGKDPRSFGGVNLVGALQASARA